ncbi:MAG: DUF4372 domain-containing protein [Lentisphaeria bacterium]|nr:DUF4372 domain-containing protein [Lentisphaeria bacterium]
MYYSSIHYQFFNIIPRYRFEKIIKKPGEERYYRHFTALKLFLTLLFAQISSKNSFDKGYYGLSCFQKISSTGTFFITE